LEKKGMDEQNWKETLLRLAEDLVSNLPVPKGEGELFTQVRTRSFRTRE
jgi:hypothetical protein